MESLDQFVGAILLSLPETQAIYLFGSHGTPEEYQDSDVDVALLLPPAESKRVGSMVLSPLRQELERLVLREVDLVNLREVATVLQKEIIMADRRIFSADPYAADEFEMLVLSFYCKLNEERQGILDEFARTGRAYLV